MARTPAKTTSRKGKPGPKPGSKRRREAQPIKPLPLDEEPPANASKPRLLDLIEALQLANRTAAADVENAQGEIEKLEARLEKAEQKNQELADQVDEEQERLSQFGLMLGDKEWKLNYAGR